jgi:hypothetical protein
VEFDDDQSGTTWGGSGTEIGEAEIKPNWTHHRLMTAPS